MLGVVLRRLWHWPPLATGAVLLVFGLVDAAYFTSNLTKIADGGWFPLLVALVAFTLLTTWARGRRLVHARLAAGNMPVEVFVKSVGHGVHRVRGTGIYLTASPDGIPSSLLHNLKHNQVLHEQVILLTVEVRDVPVVKPSKRVIVEELGHGMKRVILRFGFTEEPDIPGVLASAETQIGPLPPMTTSYFMSRQTVLAAERPGMARWRAKIFAWMMRNSATAMEVFKLPPNRVVELGSQVAI
jgi:KUP system potassium uptake protein